MSEREKYGTNSSFPFSLVFAMEIPATAETREIRHTDYPHCTVEFVCSGAGFLETNGKTFHVKKNGIYFLMPGSTHAYRPDRKDPWVKLFFTVEGPLMHELLKAYGMENVHHMPDCPELKKYFDRN